MSQVESCTVEIQNELSPEQWQHRYSFSPSYLNYVRRLRKQRGLRRQLRQDPKKELRHDENLQVRTIADNPQRQSNPDNVLEADRKLDQVASLAQPWVKDPGVADAIETRVMTSDQNMVNSIKMANDNYKAKLDRFVPASGKGEAGTTNELLRKLLNSNKIRAINQQRNLRMHGTHRNKII